ncbi:MAG: hypothetical protein R3344_04730 [Acidobacteriota bacterium]|nr:hypothetical protein [Acidobacteriota bacterium]
MAEFGDLDEGDTGRALDIGVWFATRCVVDENGERVFSDEDTGFVESLPARLLDEIAIAVSRLSGVSEEAVEEGKDGSPETANDAGGSRSPAISGAA